MTTPQNIDQFTAAAAISASDKLGVAQGDTVIKRALVSQLATFFTSGGGLGLGTLAYQNANAVAITGGSITGITDLAVADGGTGASTASSARSNLGLGTIATQDASAVAITGGTIQSSAGTSSAPGLAVGEAATGFYLAATGSMQFASAGATAGSDYFQLNVLAGNCGLVKSTGGSTLFVAGNSTTTSRATRCSTDTSGPTFQAQKARGALAAPTVVATGDVLGGFQAQGYDGAAYQIGGTADFVLTETSPSSTAMGSRYRIRCCAIGSVSQTEIASFDVASGLAMFGASNVVIDASRLFRPRSTTIAGAVAAATAGRLGYFSDANGGAGAFMKDNGTAWQKVGQSALKRLTSNADATYTPVTDGNIVRDLATKTANRKLTMAVTNVTDGYEVRVSTRGSSGGFTRDVYQSDGTTLIVSVADNTSVVVVYDGTAALWFQA